MRITALAVLVTVITVGPTLGSDRFDLAETAIVQRTVELRSLAQSFEDCLRKVRQNRQDWLPPCQAAHGGYFEQLVNTDSAYLDVLDSYIATRGRSRQSERYIEVSMEYFFQYDLVRQSFDTLIYLLSKEQMEAVSGLVYVPDAE